MPQQPWEVDGRRVAEVIGILLSAWGGPDAGIDLTEMPTPPQTESGFKPGVPSAQNMAPTPGMTGAHAKPYEGEAGITGGFGETRPGHTHAGLDIGVKMGTTLHAAMDGTVTHAASDDPNGYGTWVEIAHANGQTTRYGHMSALSVHVGDRVAAGQSIGQSGSTGHSTGPHLHFELRQDGKPIDPTPFLMSSGPITSDKPITEAAPTAEGPPPETPEAHVGTVAKQATQVLKGSPTAPLGESIDPIQRVEQDPISDTISRMGKVVPKPNQQPISASLQGMDSYFARVLQGIGAPVTEANLSFMRAWQRAEGGDSTNPFNTTQGAPGAVNFNSVGVKRYASQESGIQATIQTLTNGMYGGINAALRRGANSMDAANALASSPWGTGGLVQKILGGGG